MRPMSEISFSNLLARLFVLGICFGFVACAESNSGGGGGSGTGSVALVLTDAPTDDFVQVLITVTRIDLLGEDGAGQSETIFEGRQVFDLLALENVSEPFAIADDIRVGIYSKLRMEVEEIELVRMDGEGGFESIFPRLPGGHRIDLNPRGGFRVEAGVTLSIRLDVDARNSIHINETGSGETIFRPQVFVEIMNADRPGRLIYVEGLVEEIDRSDSPTEFWLCEVAVSHRDRASNSQRHCLTIFAEDGTSVFDDSGLSVGVASIDLGDRLGVLGRFTNDDEERFAVDAEVIELGGSDAFLSLTGVARNAFDALTGIVFVELDPGQGFAEGTVLEIEIASETRIYQATGDAIDPAEISAGSRIEVDGVLVLSSEFSDQIRAAVIFVRGLEGS